MDTSSPAVVCEEKGPAHLGTWSPDRTTEGDVVVDVSHSSLNYKDGLAVTGSPGVVSRYPLVCGIDLAGTVASSDSERWQPGDEVIATGFGLSMTHPGGYTAHQRVPAEWLLPLPATLSASRAMAIGTAGLTAMLAVLALEEGGLTPDATRPVLVTGAAGGVGSVAVMLLAELGYQVTASTGRPENAEYLTSLGATEIIDRAELSEPGRPLGKPRWSAAVDVVGGQTLANVLATADQAAPVAACGLAGGPELPTTVLPFILRGVKLIGIDSVECPVPRRVVAWERLTRDLPLEALDRITTTEPLGRVPDLAREILAGKVRGRVVIDVGA
ncbi:MAG TPA: MDR family oxidoreductase [Pseudonocardia sp.]|jgi:acrylyl-CoA reductase (NADPH)|nr:MDR family oxidoreductase [Pseudonocardia sp.]